MFEELLEKAGLWKAELARRMGVSARTVSAWEDCPPRYALAYLELLIEFNRIRPR